MPKPPPKNKGIFSQKKNSKFQKPVRNNARGECCNCHRSFLAAMGEGSARNKYLRNVRGTLSRSHIRNPPLNAFFYINPEIFMLFVKYSCEPVCKLVPRGKVKRNWTHSANNTLSCANVASIQDTWRDTNDLPCQDEQTGTSLVRHPTSI